MQRVTEPNRQGKQSNLHKEDKNDCRCFKNRGLSYVNHCFQKHYWKNKNKCFRTVTLPEANSQAYYLHKEIETNGEDFFIQNQNAYAARLIIQNRNSKGSRIL